MRNRLPRALAPLALARPGSSNNFTLNATGSPGDAEEASGTLALGQIRISARVVVRFELE